MFESKLENISDMTILNDMNPMYDNKVNNIAEYNVLHGILNNSKGNKNIIHHYLPILRGCMNRSRIFRILLYIICSSTIVMIRLIPEIKI